PDRAMQVAREAEGHPMFVAELARHGGREGASLEQVLVTRMAQLPPTARELLELIAVAGGPIDHALLVREAPGDGIPDLAALRAGRMIRVTGGGDRVETYHDRIRETVTAHLDPARVRQCHETLARAGGGRWSRPGSPCRPPARRWGAGTRPRVRGAGRSRRRRRAGVRSRRPAVSLRLGAGSGRVRSTPR